MTRPQRGQRKNYAAVQDAGSEGANSSGDEVVSKRPARGASTKGVINADDSDDASNQLSEEVRASLCNTVTSCFAPCVV
jgi:hypothetical protein